MYVGQGYHIILFASLRILSNTLHKIHPSHNLFASFQEMQILLCLGQAIAARLGRCNFNC